MLAQVIKEISSLNVIQEEVDSEFILEYIVHRENKWILSLEKDVFLSKSVDNLSFLNQDVLVDSLHSILLSDSHVDNQEHFAKGSFVDHLFDLEVGQGDFFLLIFLL